MQDPLNPLATPASHRPQKGRRIENGQEGLSEPESSAWFSRLMHQVEQISITGDEIFGLGYQSQIDVWGCLWDRARSETLLARSRNVPLPLRASQ